MELQSFSRGVHESAARATEVSPSDAYITRAWKIPAGRILHLATTISALVETIFFAAATLAFSPLYLIDNDRFNVLKNDAFDSAKVAAEASLRIFGFGKTMVEDPNTVEAPPAPQEPPTPTTLKGRGIALLKQIGITALKHPDATFLTGALATAAAAAYFFGLFETAAATVSTPIPSPAPPATIISPFCFLNGTLG